MNINQTTIQALNSKFPPKDLRWKREREKLTGVFKAHVMAYLRKNVDCIHKIYYENGANAYRYFAPTGFLASLKELESANLSQILIKGGK